MGLPLVDRGRILRQQATTERVAGSTRMVQAASAWFNALLLLPAGPASQEPSGGRRRSITSPTLLADAVDEQNDPVALHLGDKVEVETQRSGTAVWEVTEEPAPLGGLYEAIGYQAVVRRVADHQFRSVA